MGWFTGVVVLLLLQYLRVTAGVPHTIALPQSFVGEDAHQSVDDNIEDDTVEAVNRYEDVKFEHLGRVLANILVQPWPKGISPILYVEDYPSDSIQTQPSIGEEELNNVPYKRSRYYRKYPWKRQNSRYDAENRYLCQPSKEDVFRLLVALHEARQGSRGQMVNFCNRKRPASAVFTNIRFLG